MSMELISSEDLGRFSDRRKYVIVDLRSERDYSLSHYPGAVNIPYNRFDINDIGWGRTCVFYCDRGAHSISLARRLSNQGIRAVAVVTPYREWKYKIR